MKNVDLMFGFLGNGVTVCDRSRQEHGDYKTVAHIDPCGAVRLYDEKLPFRPNVQGVGFQLISHVFIMP